MKRTSGVLSVVAFAAFAAGCAADADFEKPEGAAGAEVDALRLGSSVQTLGTIAYGDARTARYANPPLYRAYRFHGAAGDRVDAWVRSPGGDAMAWLTDASRRVVAQNDDASADTLDAHVTATLAAAGDYLIMFRDYHRQTQTFTVSLAGGPAAQPCGGRTATPRTCPAGYVCTGPGLLYDAPGTCVRGCVRGDTTYAPGDSFSDGCNTCSCRADGAAICTLRACPACDPASEPQRRYIGTSPAQCMVIRYACTAGEQGFSNACGCGCEPAAR